MDNVFTDLLGLIPSFDNTLRMQPLISPNWTYWAVENLPYHGLLLSMIFDADGAHYPNLGHSKGFSIFIGNSAIFTSPNLPSHISVALPTNTASTNNITTYVNILTNPNAPYSLPSASGTSFQSSNHHFTPSANRMSSILRLHPKRRLRNLFPSLQNHRQPPLVRPNPRQLLDSQPKRHALHLSKLHPPPSPHILQHLPRDPRRHQPRRHKRHRYRKPRPSGCFYRSPPSLSGQRQDSEQPHRRRPRDAFALDILRAQRTKHDRLRRRRRHNRRDQLALRCETIPDFCDLRGADMGAEGGGREMGGGG